MACARLNVFFPGVTAEERAVSLPSDRQHFSVSMRVVTA